MDWNLRACGRRGHITYAPTEEALRDRLRVITPVGAAWRCLHCGDFAVGPPRLSGPADHAPIVLRGRAPRDATILRLLAVERFTKGLLALLAVYGGYRFRASHDAGKLGVLRDVDATVAEVTAYASLGVTEVDTMPDRRPVEYTRRFAERVAPRLLDL